MPRIPGTVSQPAFSLDLQSCIYNEGGEDLLSVEADFLLNSTGLRQDTFPIAQASPLPRLQTVISPVTQLEISEFPF